MNTVFTFNTLSNQWENTDAQITLETGHGSTVPHIASQVDHDRYTIGTFLCHVIVNSKTIALPIDLCHNVLMSCEGDSAGALVSDAAFDAFVADSGLTREMAEDVTERIAYGLNEGWRVTGDKGEVCDYSSQDDDVHPYSWTLVSLTFTDEFAATLA